MYRSFICVFFFIVNVTSFSQDNTAVSKLDSLKNKLSVAKTPKEKSRAFYSLAHFFLKKDKELTKKYTDSSYTLANTHNLTAIKSKAHNLYGLLFSFSGVYDKAMVSYKNALDLARAAKKDTLVNITLINKANLYNKIKEYSKATAVCNELINKKNLTDEQRIACLSAMAVTAQRQKFYDLSITYYDDIINYCEKMNHQYGKMLALNNIGLIYRKLNKFDKAIENCEASLVLSRKLKNRKVIAMTLLNVAVSYLKTDEVEKSIAYLKESLVIAEEEKIPLIIGDCHLYLAEAYAKTGNHKLSYKEQVMYSALREQELDKRKAAIKVDAKHTFEEKEVTIQNLTTNRFYIVFVSVLILVLLVIVLVLINKRKESITKQKEILIIERSMLDKENTTLKSKLKALAKTKQYDSRYLKNTAKNSLTNKQQQTYTDAVLDYMEEEKPYLDFEISLKKMADSLSMTTHHLSEVLRVSFEKNFHDFINIYRINEAKKIMANSEGRKYKLLSVAYDSGFKSKSSFYRVFKKHTGKTPTEYKEKLM